MLSLSNKIIIILCLLFNFFNFINGTAIVNFELQKDEVDPEAGAGKEERERRDYDVNTSEIEKMKGKVKPLDKTLKWLKSAQDMITSPAGHIVIQMAKEVLNRSTGNTQAALLGATHWRNHGYDYGRSAVPAISLNDAEADLITGFLAAQGGYDDCLYVAACSNPHMAAQYVKAAKALVDGVKAFGGSSSNNPRYYDLIKVVEQATRDSYRHLPCDTLNKCAHLF